MKLTPYPSYKPSGIDWLGDVPEHWDVKKLRYVCRFTYGDALASDDREDGEVPVFGSNGPVGNHDAANTRAPAIIVGRKGSHGKVNYSRAKAFAIDTTYFIDERLTNVDIRWLFHSLSSLELDSMSKDSAVPGLSREDAYQHALAVPSTSEQRAIAHFLDRELGTLDTLVAKKGTLIERLKEKRTALISRTVIRGLPPDAATQAGFDPRPPFKPSGIDWLGDVPEYWDVKRLRFISPHITVGIVVEPSKYYEVEGIPCLRSLNVRPNSLTDRDLVYISEDSNRLHSKSILRKGDLVAVRSGQPGTTAVVDGRYDGANCIDLIIVRRPRKGDPTFFGYFLNSDAARAQFAGGSGGAIQQHFNIATASDLQLVEPPPEEQVAIATFLDRETARIDELAGKVEAAIARLQEYRTALITAAVTGKIDVREVAA